MLTRFTFKPSRIRNLFAISTLGVLAAATACSGDDAPEASGGAGTAGKGAAGSAGSSAGSSAGGTSGAAGHSSNNAGTAPTTMGGSPLGGASGVQDAGAGGSETATDTGGATDGAQCGFHTEAEAEVGGASGGAAGAGGADGFDAARATSKSIGAHLTDGAGNPLYVFGSDVPGDCRHAPTSACVGAPCIQTWTSFNAGSRELGNGLDDAEFGDFTPAAGATNQTTYHGWPLYRYVAEVPGAVSGQGIATLWHAAKLPFFNIMLMKKKLSDTVTAKYIADGEGFAIYTSSADPVAHGNQTPTSKCDSTCSAVWPPFTLDRFILPSSFKDSDFSLFATGDGKLQVAYRGMPLYRYAADSKPGDTNGNAVSTFNLADPAL